MKQKLGRKLLSFLLTLVMVVGLMPGMSLTAYAATDTYTTLKNNATVVKFNGYNWYIIEDNSNSATEGTVTLLAADNSFGLSKFSDNKSSVYSSSKIKATLDAMTQESGAFAGVADAIVSTDLGDVSVTGAKLYLLSTSEAQNLNSTILNYNFPGSDQSGGSGAWWLRSPGSDPDYADTDVACVFANTGVFTSGKVANKWTFGVRPALKLDLSKVTFDSTSKTFSLKSSHTHSFNYTATGATITATCGATGCTLPVVDNKPTATLTIAAPLHTTYGDGNEAAAVITDTNSIKGDAKVMYQTKSGDTYGTTTETAPTDAGKHKASITLGTEGNTATAYVEYEIAPMALTIDSATATTRAYDKDSTAVTISGVTFKNGSTPVALTMGTDYTVTGAMSDVNAGNGKTVDVTVTLINGNYSLATNTTTTTVNISKAGAQTIADVTDTLLYTATSVSESVAGKMPSDAGTLSYSAGTASKTGSVTVSDFTVNATSGAVTATLSGGTAGDTVTLPVTISSTNYADSTANVVITLTAKGTQTITAADVTVSYGDTGKSVSASVTDPAMGGGAISYAVKTGSEDYIGVDATAGALTIKKVGSAIVVVTAAETDTYAKATKEVTVTINKGEGGGTPSANTLVYNGSAQALVTAGKAEGGTMMYALGTDATTAPTEGWSEAIPTGVDAKTYYVWYMVKGDANHNDTKPACVEATIAKKGLTVTAEAKSKTQGEADPALTYTAEGLVGSDTLTGALSRDAGEAPGTYAITQGTLTAGDNYEITFTSAVLTINKKDEPAPVPSGGGSSGGGGGYYGGGTVQNQRRDAYSDVIGAAATHFWGSSP